MTLDNSMFAYPEKKMFPMTDANELRKSAASFVAVCETIPPAHVDAILGRMIKAANYYGIEPLMGKTASASTEEVYNTSSGAFSMTAPKTLEDCSKAAEFILDKREFSKLAELRPAALRVVKSASNLDGDIWGDALRKMARLAGIGVGDRREIIEEFNKRGVTRQLHGQESSDFWKYASELEAMSDEDFYNVQNMQKIAECMDEIDHVQNNRHEYGKRLQAPEDVVYKYSVDDLRKEARDMLEIPSVGVVISKTAALERTDKINEWLMTYYNQEPLQGDEMLGKVAALGKAEATSLLDTLEAQEG